MRKVIVGVTLALILTLVVSSSASAGSWWKVRKVVFPVKPPVVVPYCPPITIYNPPWIHWDIGDGIEVGLFW
jgi:hypothetical protein